MLRRRIGGPTGPLASALSLGTLPFGTTVDEETSFVILDRFVEAGGTLLDTGEVRRDRPSGCREARPKRGAGSGTAPPLERCTEAGRP